MIKDNIKNANIYHNLSEFIKIGLNYLENTDFSKVSNGRYEILEDKVYANVQDYISKPEHEGKFEAHKRYIDIQYIVKGEEKIGVSDILNFEEATVYESEKDIIFLTPKIDSKVEFIELKEKEFMILTPQDAHMPMITIDQPCYVKKVVVKVLI